MSSSRRRSLHDHPSHFLAIAQKLVSDGKGAAALEMVRKAQAERPDDPLMQAITQMVLTSRVPTFHDSMLRDTVRNAAYAQAIAVAAPGRRVLDIGTGSGLLAMMAARSGAAHVYACETNPMLAATAREIIAANGLADKVTVFALHSGKLDRTRDLGGGIDLVVSEIFSDNLLGEGVLASLRHARAELCAPDALILPPAATIRVALADHLGTRTTVDAVEGFDLSAFSRHVKQVDKLSPKTSRLNARSDPADLFAFDFTADTPVPGRARVRVKSHGGRVSGIVQWLRLTIGPDIVYENAPGADDSLHWMMRYVPLPAPRDTAAGEELTIDGWHSLGQLAIWGDA
ncbi:MAG TPA: 50S ribosomal protein L11 methyltransferase [Novosphingobium sp.]|nr:50S ribosomal protein L11 methyltransferase [Novosphingobium sp.]